MGAEGSACSLLSSLERFQLGYFLLVRIFAREYAHDSSPPQV
jgi:hypothetical protein